MTRTHRPSPVRTVLGFFMLAGALSLCPPAATAQDGQRPTAQPAQPPRAAARPKPPRRSVFSAEVGMQPTGHDLTDTATFSENGEQGSLSAFSQGTGGLAIHVAAGTSVWRTLGIRVGVTYSAADQPATFTRSSPHPFFFSRPRTVSGELGAQAQTETGIHIGARVPFVLDKAKRWQGAVFGGPSLVHVSRELLEDVPFIEAYPYDTVTAGVAQLARGSGSAVSGHAGAELFWVWKAQASRTGKTQTQVGVGGGVLVAPATVTLQGVRGQDVEVQAGGVIVSAGLHLRF